MKQTACDTEQVKHGVHIAVFGSQFVKEDAYCVGDAAGEHINRAVLTEDS